MIKIIALLLLLVITICPFSSAMAESRSRAIEIDEPQQQVPLLGEVRTSKIKQSLFYDKVRPILTEDKLLTAGYISTNDRPYGKIIDSTKKKRLSNGDVVFINRGKPDGVKVGDSYFIYRRAREIRKPNEKELFGHLISIVGEMQVIEVLEKDSSIEEGGDGGFFGFFSKKEKKVTGVSAARIIKGFIAIEKGDLFIPKYETFIPTMDKDRPVKEKTISSTIIAMGQNHAIGGVDSIIYIDAGRKDGVEEGDIFGIYDNPAKGTPSYKFGYEKRVASGMVITVKDGSSTLIITKVLQEVAVGNMARFAQER